MQTLALTTEGQVEIISAYAAAQKTIDAVVSTPGWEAVGAFFMPVSSPAKLEVIGLVSGAGLVLRARLYDVTADAAVSGSVASIAGALVDTRAVSGEIDLTGGRVYRMEVEVTGAADGDGTARSVSLVN